nr:putative adhesion G protein-coupled receptor E4P [Dermacentor andersoni]
MMTQKCKTYYAPVTNHYLDGMTFKNVYCAICNGVDLSNLSCSPTRHFVPSRSGGFVPKHRNLAALFKPVVRTPSCYAVHDGRCYIQRSSEPRRRDQEWDGNQNETFTVLPSEEAPGDGGIRQYVTLVSVSLSICCLALKLVVFCAYRESRSFASKCTLRLSVTLMLTQILYLITSCLDVPTVVCLAGAALVHYGFLSTFCWTCTLSFDICRCLTALKLSSSRERVPVVYGMFCCCLPLIVVASALAVDLAVPGTVLSPGYGRLVCWIGTFWGLVVYFLVPVAMLLLCCLVFYLRVVFYVSQTSLAQNTVSGVRNRQHAHAVLFVRLALVMGSPWAIAFVGTFVESVVLDCVVNVLVGLQGVYLFLAFKDYRYFWSSTRKAPDLRTRAMPLARSLLIIPW